MDFLEQLKVIEETIDSIKSGMNNILNTIPSSVDELVENKETEKLLDVEGVIAYTKWSKKTAQKAMQDPRMKTIWVGKGPQVTLRELLNYCSLNINRSTDHYWQEG